MIERTPPGLVLWPEAELGGHQIAVLISDVHCTDGTVGNQSANEADWEAFFRELTAMLRGRKLSGQPLDVVFILNGDIIDLLRSSRWVERGVYPWDREHEDFLTTLREVMAGIVAKHGGDRRAGETSGFFGYLKGLSATLGEGVRVHFVPVLGNHDKEMQLDAEVRRMFYVECLGLSPADFSTAYRNWVATQLGVADASPWPLLPVYFASPTLKLLATHGQWRDDTNRGPTGFSRFGSGWQPERWQRDGYGGFTAPCFGDTIATGLLSHFIFHARKAIDELFPVDAQCTRPAPVAHILNILAEMDLYRPSARGVVRLLEESAKLETRDAGEQLQKLVIRQYSESLATWLKFPVTCRTAPARFKAYLPVLGWLGGLGFY